MIFSCILIFLIINVCLAQKATFDLHKRDSQQGTSQITSIKNANNNGATNSSMMVAVADILLGTAIIDNEKQIDSIMSSKAVGTGQVNDYANDIAYYIEVQLGSDQQNFSLVIDTGSYYTWVYGVNCTSDSCIGHQQFNTNNSTTIANNDNTFDINYTSGDVTGGVYNDIISFSGFETRLDFGVAQSAGSTFASFPIDGIMGLSAQDESPNSFPGVMTTLYRQSLISQDVFAINLGRASDTQDQGSITFGGLDSSKYTGDITYTKILSDSVLWTLPLGNAIVNSNVLQLNGSRSAVVDTGTTLLVMSPTDALYLHSFINGAQTDGSNFAIPCNTNVTIELEFNGAKWPISPQDYVGSSMSNDPNLCLSNIQGLQFPDQNQWILGDVFLKNVYSIFDVANQQVGFAQKSISSTNSTPKDSIVYTSSYALSSSIAFSSSLETSSQPELTLNALVSQYSNSSYTALATSTLAFSSVDVSAPASATGTSSSTKSAVTNSSPNSYKPSILALVLLLVSLTNL